MYSWKQVMVVVCLITAVSGAKGDMIILEGVDSATITTGDLIDGAALIPVTVSVAEIPGLQLTARSGGALQTVNVTSSSLGINADGGSDDTDALDPGEFLYLSFSSPVVMNQIDFNVFDAGETFTLQLSGGSSLEIAYDDLDNKSSDVIALDLEIPAGTEIQLAAGSGSVIGLDGIDVSVIPEPATFGLLVLGGLGILAIRRRHS